MGTFILKRKTYSDFTFYNPYAPKARLHFIEACPFVDENYDVVNKGNIKVDENSALKLFKDPVTFIVPKIFEYERDYQQGQTLRENDYNDISCFKVEVNGPKDIEIYVKPIVGTKLYKQYGPFIWHIICDLRGTRPVVDVFDGFGEI